MSVDTRSENLDLIAERYAVELSRCTGAEAARLRDDMMRAALPMADRLAGRYRLSREAGEDVAQAARLGLVKAVERYDPERGSFTAYAVLSITGEIKRYFRDHTWHVHVPRRLQDLALAVRRAQDDLSHELRRPPTEAEIAHRCGVDVGDVASARLSGAGYRSVSLHQPVGADGAEIGDFHGSPDAAVESVADLMTVHGLLERLPARERRIIALRFDGDRTQTDIATELGISQMHVSRLLNRALGWLRAAMLSDVPPPYPGDPEPDPDDRLTVRVDGRSNGRTRVSVHGEVDRDNAGRLRETLLTTVARTPAGSTVMLDLSRMPLLDAAGVAVLLAVHEAARVRQVAVVATGLQPFVRKIAETAGLGALLTD
jgi:RNA polymerase sigma-B factor